MQEEKAREYRRERKKEKKRKEAEDDSGGGMMGMDPDMAAIMGFGGFGSSSKKT